MDYVGRGAVERAEEKRRSQQRQFFSTFRTVEGGTLCRLCSCTFDFSVGQLGLLVTTTCFLAFCLQSEKRMHIHELL